MWCQGGAGYTCIYTETVFQARDCYVEMIVHFADIADFADFLYTLDGCITYISVPGIYLGMV